MAFHSEEGASKKVSLESVKQALNEWRQQRVKGSRIPKDLWQDIKSLTTALNYEGVAALLKIPPKRLRKAAGLVSDSAEQASKAPISFAEVSFTPLKENILDSKDEASSQSMEPSQMTLLEMTRANGTRVKVQGLDKKNLVTLLQHLG